VLIGFGAAKPCVGHLLPNGLVNGGALATISHPLALSRVGSEFFFLWEQGLVPLTRASTGTGQTFLAIRGIVRPALRAVEQ